jgi:hypothetical protein
MFNEIFYPKVKFKCISEPSKLFFIISLFLSHFYTYKATYTISTTTTTLTYTNTTSIFTNVGGEENFFLSAEEALESYEKNNLGQSNLAVKDCSSLFPRCLCSFKESTRRNYLYCNDPSVKKIPDFKAIYELFERYVRAVHSNLNLIFSKVDFTSKIFKCLI